MKKRIIALGLCLALAFSMTACGSDKKKKASSGNVNTVNEANTKADMSGTKYAAEVKLADYKNYTVANSLVETKDDYKKSITYNMLNEISQASFADLSHVEKVQGTVAKSDVVNIDFVGYVDGKEFEGGSSKAFNLGIGSGTFIDGFEDGLIGKKTGETVDLNLKFPDDYSNEDLKGKAVVFKVTINYILGLNDEFINDNSELVEFLLYRVFYNTKNVSNMAEYEKVVEDGLKMTNIIIAIRDRLIEETEVKPNQIELDKKVSEVKAEYEAIATQNGMTLEEVLEYQGYESVTKLEEAITKDYESRALIMKIVEEEGIVVTEEEYKVIANATIAVSDGTYKDIPSYQADYPKQDDIDDIIVGKVYYKISEYIKAVPDAEAVIKPTEETK